MYKNILRLLAFITTIAISFQISFASDMRVVSGECALPSKEAKKFNIELMLNEEPSQKLKYKKEKSDLDIKGRSGWSCTKSGIWHVDILVSEFKKITITGSKKILVKAKVDKIE